MNSIAQEIEAQLHREIPLSGHMNFGLLSITDRETRALLPLAGNTNHLGTQFGGSLFSAAALSCYSTLLAILRRLGRPTSNIVIVDSSVRYLLPGDGDVEYRVLIEPSEVSRIESEIQLKGRSRARFSARAYRQDRLILDFTALYKIVT